MRNSVPVSLLVLCVVAAGLALHWLADDEDTGGQGMSADSALAGVREIAGRFPPPTAARGGTAELGAKPGQFAESWLFAGLVHDQQDRPFGFQLEISRIAIQRQSPQRQSDWAARDVYRARFSVEPPAAATRSGERLSRAALGLAGARRAPAEAWVEDWRFVHDAEIDAFRLEAGEAGASLALRLDIPEHGPFPVGDEFHAGHWWPRLRVAGTLTLDSQQLPVTGTALLERLWGKALPAGQGQLALARLWLDTADGGVLRCQQLRRRAGGGMPLTECQNHPSPAAPSLVAADVVLAPVETGWHTMGGVRLPLAWTLGRNADRSSLRLEPLGGRRSLSMAGDWSGIVIAADAPAWGLLELSNFAKP